MPTKIKVIRSFSPLNANHLFLIAWDEHHCVKFDYPFAPLGLTMHYRTQDMYVDEDSVIIETNMSVKEIYNRVAKSKFSPKKKSFDYIINNCSDAVTFALKMANINLKLDTNKYSFKHHGFWVYAPSNISTPKEVLEAAKKYKIEQLKKVHLFDKMEAIKEDLKGEVKDFRKKIF